MNNKQIFKGLAAIMIVAVLSVAAACANSNHDGGPGGGPGGGPQGPPPEAFEACQGKQVGEIVTITGRGGKAMEATCELVAVPQRPLRQ